MKNILLLIIKIYWIVIPANKRRTCLFKQSCSNYVFSNTKQFGLIKGLQSLRYRMNTCREGSALFVNPLTGKIQMILPNNEVVDQDNISDAILSQAIHIS